MNGRIFLVACFLPVIAWAQSFGGLGSKAADEFATPQRNFVFDFPADHGASSRLPDRVVVSYCKFRRSSRSAIRIAVDIISNCCCTWRREGWSSPQVWFAHAAVTTPEAHFSTERFARGGIGQAGVTVEPFRAWIDEWRLKVQI